MTYDYGNCAAVRSGDYYLFEDLDEKVELDLLHERPSAGIEDAITDRKMGDKLTVEQVKKISDRIFVFLFKHSSNNSIIIKIPSKRNHTLFVVKNLKEKKFQSKVNRPTKSAPKR